MAFADVSPEQDFIYSRNSDIIPMSDIAEFMNEFRPVALQEMQIDIELAQRLTHNDTASLDAIYDNFSDVLNNALGYKMLEHFYTRHNDGDGINAERYKLYKASYNSIKQQFGQMQGRTALSSQFSVPIARG